MDQDKIDLLRIMVGDTPNSPFYQLFTDEQLQKFIDLANGNVLRAVKYAAISAAMQLSGWSTRERTGDIEVWNSLSTNYLAAIKLLLDNSTADIPDGMIPWAAGMSRTEMCEMARNPDRIPNKLLEISMCDCDNLCRPLGLTFGGC